MRTFIIKNRRNRLTFVLLILLSACDTSIGQEKTLTPAITIQAYQHKKLQTIFSTHDYSWSNLDRGVPPLVLKSFPDDLHQIYSTDQKKTLFFKSILPMVLLANEEIEAQRTTLLKIFLEYDQTGAINDQEQEELTLINRRYRIKVNPLKDEEARERLMRRVDTIPESLVLAQAANESGWGTSRFARKANNIFGEWTFTPGTGLVPEDRPEGESYEVRRFSTLYQSVRSYMRNINTHRAYLSLRQMREELRQNRLAVTGFDLSTGLDNYSTRRGDYSREIQLLIKANRLEQITGNTYLRDYASLPVLIESLSTTGLFSCRDELKYKIEEREAMR